jgi:hypothetical protein
MGESQPDDVLAVIERIIMSHKPAAQRYAFSARSSAGNATEPQLHSHAVNRRTRVIYFHACMLCLLACFLALLPWVGTMLHHNAVLGASPMFASMCITQTTCVCFKRKQTTTRALRWRSWRVSCASGMRTASLMRRPAPWGSSRARCESRGWRIQGHASLFELWVCCGVPSM